MTSLFIIKTLADTCDPKALITTSSPIVPDLSHHHHSSLVVHGLRRIRALVSGNIEGADTKVHVLLCELGELYKRKRRPVTQTTQVNNLPTPDINVHLLTDIGPPNPGSLHLSSRSSSIMRHNIRRIVCTGVGIVSPLGLGARRSWSALLESRSGLTELRFEHSFEGCQSRVAAYVPADQLEKALEDPTHSYMVKNSKQLSRATTFAMLAAHEALEDAHLLDDQNQMKEEFRASCGVAIGQGMVDFQDIYANADLILNPNTREKGFRKMSPFFMTRALINMSAGNISIRYKINGPNHCVSTACATGAHSLGDAFSFIQNSKANLMVCGSTESAINSLAMAGFERLRALSTEFNHNPTAASRPFDTDRCGFVMGEGAGVVVLEELEHALSRGLDENDIYCEVLGYGTSSDAHHLTAPLPDGGGAKLSMMSALKDANLEVSSISHINAHATSTPLGDDIECNAIEDLFYPDDASEHQNEYKNDRELTVTSCKASIGHLLGGAGGVESIFAMLSCKDSILPHCLNLEQPLSTTRNLVKFIRDKPQKWAGSRRILVKNSFGFGGTNASLVISSFAS